MDQVGPEKSLEKRVNFHHFELYQVVVADELSQFAVVRFFGARRIEAFHFLGDILELFWVEFDHRYVEQAESIDTGEEGFD